MHDFKKEGAIRRCMDLFKRILNVAVGNTHVIYNLPQEEIPYLIFRLGSVKA
jgi:hypothetical protein